MMAWVAAIVGVVAVSVAWALVRRGDLSIWRVMPIVYGTLGLISLLVADPRLTGDPELAVPTLDTTSRTVADGVLGLSIGMVLFGVTRMFVAIVVPRWPRFAAHTQVQYAQRLGIGIGVAVALSVFSLVGEELFWRGLVQAGIAASNGAVIAAGVAWLAYLLANLESRSLPVVAGAVVAGAVWAALPLVTGGILASLCCHAAWTTLMLVLPPRPGRAKMST